MRNIIISLFFCLMLNGLHSQVIVNPYIFGTGGGGGGGSLTLATSGQTAWDVTTSPKTINVTVNSGDVIVVSVVAEGNSASFTATDGGDTYTNRQDVNVANFCRATLLTTTTTLSGSITISIANGGSSIVWGASAMVFRNSTGIGASTKANTTSGAPSLALTTTAANSFIVVVNGDWNATDGTSRTWRTVNSNTPSAGNGQEISYFRNTTNYATYTAYYTSVGATGSKTVGLSAPGSQKYSICAIEIKP